jgi:hypothetical protein
MLSVTIPDVLHQSFDPHEGDYHHQLSNCYSNNDGLLMVMVSCVVLFHWVHGSTLYIDKQPLRFWTGARECRGGGGGVGQGWQNSTRPRFFEANPRVQGP